MKVFLDFRMDDIKKEIVSWISAFQIIGKKSFSIGLIEFVKLLNFHFSLHWSTYEVKILDHHEKIVKKPSVQN